MKYDSNNFFVNTKATFKGCNPPKRKPDYISRDRDGYTSSKYWYTKTGVIRFSRHWSEIRTIGIRGIPAAKRKSEYWDNFYIKHWWNVKRTTFSTKKVGTCHWVLKTTYKTQFGFCKYENFKRNLKQ